MRSRPDDEVPQLVERGYGDEPGAFVTVDVAVEIARSLIDQNGPVYLDDLELSLHDDDGSWQPLDIAAHLYSGTSSTS